MAERVDCPLCGDGVEHELLGALWGSRVYVCPKAPRDQPVFLPGRDGG